MELESGSRGSLKEGVLTGKLQQAELINNIKHHGVSRCWCWGWRTQAIAVCWGLALDEHHLGSTEPYDVALRDVVEDR